jgi:hypothetical protein
VHLARAALSVSLVALVMSITTVCEAVRPPAGPATAQLTMMAGEAELIRPGASAPTLVTGVAIARPGDLIATGADGVLLVDFAEGSEATVPPSTTVLVLSAGAPVSGGFRLGGSGWARLLAFVDRLAGQAGQVGPNDAAAEVRGAGLLLLALPAATDGEFASARIPDCRRT